MDKTLFIYFFAHHRKFHVGVIIDIVDDPREINNFNSSKIPNSIKGGKHDN